MAGGQEGIRSGILLFGTLIIILMTRSQTVKGQGQGKLNIFTYTFAGLMAWYYLEIGALLNSVPHLCFLGGGWIICTVIHVRCADNSSLCDK